MRTIFLSLFLLSFMSTVAAQDGTTSTLDDDSKQVSLFEKFTKIEKKHDLFNVYMNFAASAHATESNDKTWETGFKNREMRLEITGNLNDKLYYHFRHRLNRSTLSGNHDNFARATDLMFVGFKPTSKIDIKAGKLCQIWGGYEYDENPTFIYQYSDLLEYMEIYTAGISVSYKPSPAHELAFEIANADTEKFADRYAGADKQGLRASQMPLMYIFNWNGHLFDGKLQTRWSIGAFSQAKHKYSRLILLGQRLVLPKFQCYVDYMAEFDGIDRLQIASTEAAEYLERQGKAYFEDLHHQSVVTKIEWQPANRVNLFAKGMIDWISATKDEPYKDYRKAYGYIAGAEYYPFSDQNLRLFLAYIGRKFDYNKACGLKNYTTNRVELGLMCKLKLF